MNTKRQNSFITGMTIIFAEKKNMCDVLNRLKGEPLTSSTPNVYFLRRIRDKQ